MGYTRLGSHKVSDLPCFEFFYDKSVITVKIDTVVVSLGNSVPNQSGRNFNGNPAIFSQI